MTHVIETHKHNGYTVEIAYDQYGGSESPRSNESNLGLFLGFPHRSYSIGDEQVDPRTIEIPCVDCDGTGTGAVPNEHADCGTCEGRGSREPVSEAEVMEHLRVEHGARVIQKVGMIDHSGVSYYMGGGASAFDPGGWDSGTCGYILDRPDRLKDLGCEDFSDEKIIENLALEIKEYGAWCNGEVYTISVSDQNGDVVESCGGFIGDYAFEKQTWMDLVPSDPPPATLHRVRYTDKTLDVIEAALKRSAAPDDFDPYPDPSEGSEFLAVLSIVQESRGKHLRDEEDDE
ncbi:MAG: hypothetical protein ABIQ39_15625 [Ilumatobacteraceae bacterium]